jgi:glycosyltransferase involved in cell wall biosynthesis
MAVLALARALSDSNVTGQKYTFIVRENMRAWLAPYVYGPCKLEGIPEPIPSVGKKAFRSIALPLLRLKGSAPLRSIWSKLSRRTLNLPVSDGYVESQGFDVVHFPTQAAYLTELPTIYQPWDLQHLHLPHFFSNEDFARREREYRAFCNQAACVCVQAEWTKQDIINQYGVAEEKIVVIPWGSVFDAYESPSAEEIRKTVDTFSLPSSYCFYPAVTWPHKNHEAIIRALHILKSEYGMVPQIICTGSSTPHRSVLDKQAREFGVADQLRFLGFVTPVELQAVFRTATAMIFPSRFEGFGLPILEAFHARLPVLSANATTLPEVARDAALYFNPNSPAELAALMKEVLEKPELRQDLIKKGTHVLSGYSIADMATNFQALYDRAAASSGHNQQLQSAPAGR